MTACPKPEKPVRGTAAAIRYMGLVAQLPCCCCGRYAVQVHHCIHGRFSQSRASDFDTIPLCAFHHGRLHQSPFFWREHYGQDTDFLEPTRKAVEQLKRQTIGGRS